MASPHSRPPGDPPADLIVIGLGAVGSAVVLQAARRGARVIGLDRFHPPHDQGSSHGHTRITRLAVGEGEAYVPLARRSHALWREFEALTGETLYRATGCLVMASAEAWAGHFHGQSGFFDRTAALAVAHGIAHERMDGAEVRRRFAAFAPADDAQALFEPEGGVLFPEACVRVQLALARANGAQLRLGERVRALQADGEGVAVQTDRATLRAAQVVWAGGAWMPGAVGGALKRRTRVLRQALHWFRTDRPERFAPERCPSFIWLHGPSQEDMLYGFPMVDGMAGVKVGSEQMHEACDPDAVERQVPPEQIAALYRGHIQGRLPDLRPEVLASATCLYTMAGDGHFIIDRHPALPRVTLASACSGHGFKHSAALGEALAAQALGLAPTQDLRPFATLAAQAG